MGGYWNTVMGALLSVWASILDGCDGEVARLKLQVSKLGCWLETICDYLYYLFIFVGMSIGLTRSRGTEAYLVWGAVLSLEQWPVSWRSARRGIALHPAIPRSSWISGKRKRTNRTATH